MGDAVIVPRWEWRTFGTRFGAAETYLAALSPTGVQESDERTSCRPRATPSRCETASWISRSCVRWTGSAWSAGNR